MVKDVNVALDDAMDAIEKRQGKRPTRREIAKRLDVGSLKTLNNWKHDGGQLLAQMKELSRWSGISLDRLIQMKKREK